MITPLVQKLIPIVIWLLVYPAGVAAGEIHQLITEGDVGRIATLLAEDSTLIATVDENGQTPLHLATGTGNPNIIRLLLDLGAPLETRDNREVTPLVSAISHNDSLITRFLLDRGGVS